MPNYENGKIYAIRSYQTNDIYIGATTQPLSIRLGGHKKGFKQWLKNNKKYMSSFEILKYGDSYIELLKPCPCKNKEELSKCEGEYIRANPHCVNKNIAGRTLEEWSEDTKEQRKQYKKQYVENNKEKIKQRQKIYYENNKDKIKQYYENNKDWFKRYSEDNKEKIKQYKKQHYEDNKEKIRQYRKQYRKDNKEKIKQYNKQYREEKNSTLNK